MVSSCQGTNSPSLLLLEAVIAGWNGRAILQTASEYTDALPNLSTQALPQHWTPSVTPHSAELLPGHCDLWQGLVQQRDAVLGTMQPPSLPKSTQ